ncbi:NAD-dependent succinate-semialdehyde dehydrogenase [Candidatus Albibeggiatoa sp. nov. NOAA]|uniref:NAD-dependent succinate-semialdehyde dehydrogenase n=1 Tax=Candidatus Albibeggiatoa sp. nov. NOAA TaxID=3162724 RepID=UPI0032F9DD44|nr:NAD-dependent succinate-semialdehyde dehydrogenase [Thiotrichaceae bacterium]
MTLSDSELFQQHAYINGEWCSAPQQFEVTNPATLEVLGTVPDMGQTETEQAIEAAHQAWGDWKNLQAKQRAAILQRWYQLIIQHQDDLAYLMTLEQGKPLAESKGEVVYGASFIEWFAEEAKRVYGDVIPSTKPNQQIVVLKQPIGVVAAITPWNFPIAMITRKCAPALAVGCPVVVKPAESTPFSALAIAKLAERAGFPKGVFNVVTSNQPAVVGQTLTQSPLVRKLSFTGSTQTGKLLMRQCADTVKKISLELGGNAPFIVFDDADLDQAVEGVIASKYRNTGQTCVCANRLLVQDSIYEAFSEKLIAKVKQLQVAQGLEADAQQGPLINEAAVNKVENQIQDAIAQGATLALGGQRHELGGTFFQPTVLTDVSTNMLIAQEETFGPVAPLFRFQTEQEAIALANNTPAGLAAYFYSQNVGRVWRVSEALEYGMVGVNEGVISTEVAPFGGVKESGIGREGSKYGIDDYLETKYVCMGGLG